MLDSGELFMKKNVLFLTNIPAPYRVDFFNEMTKYCNLTVVYERMTAKDREDEWYGTDMKYNVICLNGYSIGNDEAFSTKICKVIKERKNDLIIVGVYSTWTARLAIDYMLSHKIKFWISADGGFAKNDNAIKKLIKSHYISSAQGYFSSGKKTDEYLISYGADADKIYRYPFTSLREENILKEPIEIEQKKLLRKQLGLNEKKTVLAIGQFIHRKGFDILLEAAGKVKGDYNFCFIGGEAPAEYDKYKSDNIQFISFLKSDVLAQYYKAADVFVLPTREDIWGLVINEAMGYGLPIITTDMCIAGLELVNGNGKIVPSENVDVLAETIDSVLSDEEKQMEMGRKSLEIIKNFTIEKMVEAHYKVIEQIEV